MLHGKLPKDKSLTVVTEDGKKRWLTGAVDRVENTIDYFIVYINNGDIFMANHKKIDHIYLKGAI